MSAIAGLVTLDGLSIDRTIVERLIGLIKPYGSDAQNCLRQGSVALCRALFRTTPEDYFDQQPLIHVESGTFVVFDGRIDNRDELARALELTREQANLMADSALVLRACVKWDDAAAARLLGDFALACWQPSRRRLWLARDPIGFRPLFWYRNESIFAFATVPKAIFAIPGIERQISEEALHDFLCLIPPVGAGTFFKGISRVEPGQVLFLDDGIVTSRYYHRFVSTGELRLKRDEDYVEALREQVNRAVACRLRSNGPIATELSSGLDSSTVAAFAARHLAVSDRRLIAYTAVPKAGFHGRVGAEWHADEGPGARAVAARFGNIDHVLIESDDTTPVDHLRETIEHMDRAPLNICNNVWVTRIRADAVRRGARVLLNGGFGNMTLSYEGLTLLPFLLRRGRFLSYYREIKGLKREFPSCSWRMLVRFSLAPFMPDRVWRALEARAGRELKLEDYSPVNASFSARMRAKDRARRAGHELSLRPPADGKKHRISMMMFADIGEYSAAANAMGIEVRDPTADVRLIEFCLSLPENQFLRDGKKRWLIRRLVADLLPPEVLDVRTRGLQAANWYEAAGAGMSKMREVFAGLETHESVGDYIDLKAMREALDSWPEAGWEQFSVDAKYRLKLLRGISAGSFIRYVEDDNR
jgi:asparagine synthase (glutamine-hydrolysing)